MDLQLLWFKLTDQLYWRIRLKCFFHFQPYSRYNKDPLCYNLYWSLLASQFLSNFFPIPSLHAEIPDSYADVFIFVFRCTGSICGQVPIEFLRSITNNSKRAMSIQGGGAGSHWWQKICTSVHAQLFWRAIYCANPRTDTSSHSESRSLRVLGSQYLRIMQKYYL